MRREEIDTIGRHIPSVVVYQNRLEALESHWNTLNLLNQVNEGGASMDETQQEFASLKEELLHNLTVESIKQLDNTLRAKSQVVVDIVIRNLFERTADIGFLATDDSIRAFIHTITELRAQKKGLYVYDRKRERCVVCPEPFRSICKRDKQTQEAMHPIKEVLCMPRGAGYKEELEFRNTLERELNDAKEAIKERFLEYTHKYSVYDDVIVCDLDGTLLVSMKEGNPTVRTRDPIIQKCLTTQQEYVEQLGFSDLASDKAQSLLYGFRITQSNEAGSEPIGVLILSFRFDDELKGVFAKLKENSPALHLMLLDKDQTIIASSNPLGMPLGLHVQTVLDAQMHVTMLGGRKYLSKTAQTKGYQGFFGLGWYGHVMIALEDAFATKMDETKSSMSDIFAALDTSELFSKELLSIPIKAKKIQDDLNRTVWNGSLVEKNNIAKKLLAQISTEGEKTKKLFSDSIGSLHTTIVETLLESVEFSAYLGIDIMDRNLYERANDCRWWALTPKFRSLLSHKTLSHDDHGVLSSILAYINNLYTVYTTLWICDRDKKVVASSKSESGSIAKMVEGEYIDKTLAIKNNTQAYAVSPFEASSLYQGAHTYIYAAAIPALEGGKAVGCIGIVFDAKPQFQAILDDICPQGGYSIALFCESSGKVIATSAQAHGFEIGSLVRSELQPYCLVEKGGKRSSIIAMDGVYYALGVRSSAGYREYKNDDGYTNGVVCMVLTKLSAAQAKPKQHLHTRTTLFVYKKDTTPTYELGTFFLGRSWCGFYVKDLDGSIGVERLKVSKTGHALSIGHILYKGNPIEVISLGAFFDASDPLDHIEEKQIVVFKAAFEDQKVQCIGLLCDVLGPIVEIPLSAIATASSVFGTKENFVCEIAKPPEGQHEMLSIFSPKHLLERLVHQNM